MGDGYPCLKTQWVRVSTFDKVTGTRYPFVLPVLCLKHTKLYMTYFINRVHIFLEWREGIIGFFVFFNPPPVLLVGSFLVLVVICAVAWSCIHIVFQCF